MAIIVLVIDDAALARVNEAAHNQNEKFDVLLSEQFSEFLYKQQYSDKAPVVKATNGGAQPVDSRDKILGALIRVASQQDGKFVFNDLVPLVPELDALPKQEQTTYASLFARRFHEGGLVRKLGKNSNKATEYEAVPEEELHA